MPIYEYKCPNGHLLEVFHGMNEPGPQQCEVCGATPLQRVLHPVAVHYKGSGFYSTDYGKGGRKAAKDRRLELGRLRLVVVGLRLVGAPRRARRRTAPPRAPTRARVVEQRLVRLG